jgi:hypothetical protein
MKRAAYLAPLLVLVPLGVFAATVESGRTLVVSEPPVGNAYVFGGDLSVAAPVTGDLMAAGGSVVVSSPVSGDGFIAGGSVDVRKPIGGDLRVAGGRVVVEDAVAGDLVAAAGTIEVKSAPSFAWVAGQNVSFQKGARGPVTIFGSNITLSGEYTGDVTVTASDSVTLTSGTVIHGQLRYDAPQQADIPADAVVNGGVVYTGKSYLPTTQEAQTFAVAGASIFFFIRILAGVIAAGLLAGLFPRFSQAVADRALSNSVSRFILLGLLGFGILVATPVLVLLLLISFAGAGVAFILLAAYVLLLLLSYIYAAVIAGAALARQIAKRPIFYWRDAVFGMLALSIISLVPIVGGLVFLILFAAATGAIVSLSYRFAYPKDADVLEIG